MLDTHFGVPATPGSIAGLHAKAPASPPAAPASPPTVKVVSELTRAEKDAALLAQATDLSLGSPGSDLSAAPSPLLTVETLPPPLLESPEYRIIKQVLSARVDPTLKVWMSRSLYDESVLSDFRRWSDGASPQHRDASEALASLADLPHR